MFGKHLVWGILLIFTSHSFCSFLPVLSQNFNTLHGSNSIDLAFCCVKNEWFLVWIRKCTFSLLWNDSISMVQNVKLSERLLSSGMGLRLEFKLCERKHQKGNEGKKDMGKPSTKKKTPHDYSYSPDKEVSFVIFVENWLLAGRVSEFIGNFFVQCVAYWLYCTVNKKVHSKQMTISHK